MDNEALVEAVTRIIMERIAQAEGGGPATSVVTFGDVPGGLIAPGFAVRAGQSAAEVAGADIIVLTQAAFQAFHGGGAIPAALASVGAAAGAAAGGCCGGASFDLSDRKVVSERDIRALNLTGGSVIKVRTNAIVTALARDYANSQGAKFVR